MADWLRASSWVRHSAAAAYRAVRVLRVPTAESVERKPWPTRCLSAAPIRSNAPRHTDARSPGRQPGARSGGWAWRRIRLCAAPSRPSPLPHRASLGGRTPLSAWVMTGAASAEPAFCRCTLPTAVVRYPAPASRGRQVRDPRVQRDPVDPGSVRRRHEPGESRQPDWACRSDS